MTDAATVDDTTPRPGRRQLAWHLASTAVMVLVFAMLALLYLQQWRKTGQITGLVLVVEETLVVALFVCRRRPQRTSSALVDWALAAGGTWLILLLRPQGRPLLGLGDLWIELQLAGLIGAVVGVATLGRSFGIVAAERGLKTDGVYGLVRHPIYLAYLATQLGYLLQHAGGWNAAIVVAATGCQIGRIFSEERLLAGDAAYRLYRQHVRFRLIPGVF